MSEYIFDVVSQTSKLDWAYAFQRTGAFPLDRTSLFSSLADAEAYAKGDESDARKVGGVSYVGQPVSVYDADNNSVALYIIDADRSLKEVGSASLAADDSSIEIVNDKVQLKNFGVNYYAYVPAERNEAGEITKASEYVLTEGFKEGLEPRVHFENDVYSIAWYEPSGDVAEDIAATVEVLKEDISSVKTDIDDIQKHIGAPAEGDVAASGLYAKLEEKANKSDIYTKTEVEGLIAAADHLKRITVAGVESINVLADDAEQYIYMVPNTETGNYDEYMVIDGEVEKVGDWKVDLTDYATKEDLNEKVDKQDNARLITDEEASKLASIPAEAEENFVKEVSEELKVENGKLSVVEIAQSKVNGLIDKLDEISLALESKVDTEENSRLISADEISKLAAIKDLIQSVDLDKFTIDENGKLLLNSIQINEIDELADKLAEKVDKVSGSRLITEEEATKLEKLSIDGSGNVGLSGTVSAANVQELYNAVVNIVTGSGEGIYDGVQRPLLAIASGAERNIVHSVDENQLSVDDNRKLSVKAVGMDIVTGLNAALAEKATTSSVTNIADLLNKKTADYDNRIAALEGRLTWQRLTD